jgi:hypothetical protein
MNRESNIAERVAKSFLPEELATQQFKNNTSVAVILELQEEFTEDDQALMAESEELVLRLWNIDQSIDEGRARWEREQKRHLDFCTSLEHSVEQWKQKVMAFKHKAERSKGGGV